MELKQADNLGYANQIVDGIRELSQLLESPNMPPVAPNVFVVFEVACEKVRELVGEAMALDGTKLEEKTGGKK